MARRSRRSSPTPAAAATMPTPSPPAACSISRTRSSGERPDQHGLRVGQHHRQSQEPGVQHLRQSLQPDDRPQLRRTTSRLSGSRRSSPTGATPSPTLPRTPMVRRFTPSLYVSAGNSFGTGSGVFQSLDGGKTWTLFPDRALRRGDRRRLSASCRRHVAEPVPGQHRPQHGMPDLAGPYNASHGAPDRGGPRRPDGSDLRPGLISPSTWRR